MPPADTIEFDEQFLKASHLLENSRSHIFITGKAGTGKSTLLQYFWAHTTKRVAVLAPTGVAAVNVRGQTIHSFFRFRPDITPEAVAKIRLRRENKEMFKSLDAIIIDEVSMVRADLLDCVDSFLRIHGRKAKEPFGGIQMIFIGDLYQLPPVIKREDQELFREHYDSPYFFSAKAFQAIEFELIDLARIYRQHEDNFIELLSAIRNNKMTGAHFKELNARYRPDFEPPPEDLYVYLATTNALVDKINADRLRQLSGRSFHFDGQVEGDFESKSLPTHPVLEFKIGAQVMLLNNDGEGRWVNGSVGTIKAVRDDLASTPVIEVELEGGVTVEVAPFRWEMYRFFFNDVSQAIESESVGAFVQYPLKLAWAVTIHKSQGKTFSKVIVDIGSGAFSHGQTYVALSRCMTLEGLVLRRPIGARDIMLDPRVRNFMQKHQIVSGSGLAVDSKNLKKNVPVVL